MLMTDSHWTKKNDLKGSLAAQTRYGDRNACDSLQSGGSQNTTSNKLYLRSTVFGVQV